VTQVAKLPAFLTRIDVEQLIFHLTPALLAASAATITAAYYQLHGPILHGIMLISLLWWALRLKSGRGLGADGATRVLAGIFLLYAIVAVISAGRVGFNPDAVDRLENFVYFLAAALMLPFLVQVRPHPAWFWVAVAMTSALSGIYALWEMPTFAHAYEQATGLVYRAGGSKGKPIPFGDIATLSSVLCLLGASTFQGRRHLWTILFLIAAGLGLYASLVSGTRAAWLVLPTGLLIIVLHLIHGYPKRRRAILLGLLCLALVGTGLIAQSDQIRERLSAAVSEIRDYRPGANVEAGNSLGERFEMWRAAWQAYEGHPLIGIGVGQLNAYFKQDANEGRISQAIVEFDHGNGHTHAHNDYIHALATRGLLGLGSLLLLYLVPLAFFVRNAIRGAEMSERALGYAGVLVILSFMQYSLTDSILLMRFTAGYFVLLTCWLLAMNLNRRRPD